MSWHCFGEKKMKARKSHQCILCCGQIPAGAEYVRREGVDDGEFITMKMHVECEALTRDWDYMDWETFSPGDLTPELINDMAGK